MSFARLLGASALALASLATLAAAPEIPHMTRDEATAYVARERLQLTPDNLFSPILHGDAARVEALLSAGVDPNAKATLPQSPMQAASMSCAGKTDSGAGVLVMIEVLLAHGARVDDPGIGGLSALMIATQQCSAAVVERLLRAGASITQRTPQGYTPLAMALVTSNYDAAEVLLEAGAKLDAEAATALMQGQKDNARLAALVKRARR